MYTVVVGKLFVWFAFYFFVFFVISNSNESESKGNTWKMDIYFVAYCTFLVFVFCSDKQSIFFVKI